MGYRDALQKYRKIKIRDKEVLLVNDLELLQQDHEQVGFAASKLLRQKSLLHSRWILPRAGLILCIRKGCKSNHILCNNMATLGMLQQNPTLSLLVQTFQ